MRTNNTKLKDAWQTPKKLIDMLPNIDLDPCAGDNTNIGDVNWTEGGLKREWFGVVFVNPPFTMKKEFLKYAIEQRENADRIFVLTPDSTDTISWWHKYIAEYSDYVWFSEGRIAYIDPESGKKGKNPTFGTTITTFGDLDKQTKENMKKEGHLTKTIK